MHLNFSQKKLKNNIGGGAGKQAEQLPGGQV
jgi:hypothetical protein